MGFVENKEEEAAKCLKEMDLDGDGKVSYAEFMVKWRVTWSPKTLAIGRNKSRMCFLSRKFFVAQNGWSKIVFLTFLNLCPRQHQEQFKC